MSLSQKIKTIKKDIEALRLKISIAKTHLQRDKINKDDLHRLLEEIEELL
ncbi:MAG: hypothetical protein M0R77_19220 [Gammaproteobacteria bacterium]|nr:hypothetical protein [Gammaproteobacteria bacterium]